MTHQRWNDPAPEVASLVLVTLVTAAVAAIAIAHRTRFPRDYWTDDSAAASRPPMPGSTGRPWGCSPDLEEKACWGEVVYRTSGCTACHSNDPAVQRPAPSFAMRWGVERPLEGGGSVVVDEAYVRESIVEPQAKIAAGYTSPSMPAARFSDRQLVALIAYMRTLEPPSEPPDASTDTSRERVPRARGRRR